MSTLCDSPCVHIESDRVNTSSLKRKQLFVNTTTEIRKKQIRTYSKDNAKCTFSKSLYSHVYESCGKEGFVATERTKYVLHPQFDFLYDLL